MGAIGILVEADVADWSAGKTYHFMTSVVAPRPIAWVTSTNEDGSVNAAPFSWFQSVCADPPMVMIAFSDRPGARGILKDTPRNIQEQGEFVINSVTKDMARAMVATSAPLPVGESEVEATGLATTPSVTVHPPRLRDAVAHLECRYVETHRYGGKNGTTVIIGEVVHVHADDGALDERGNLSPDAGLLARLGGAWYTAATKESVFEVERPMDLDGVRGKRD